MAIKATALVSHVYPAADIDRFAIECDFIAHDSDYIGGTFSAKTGDLVKTSTGLQINDALRDAIRQELQTHGVTFGMLDTVSLLNPVDPI